MGNMIHCRFRNTLLDLADCERNMDEVGYTSDEELRARKELVKLCQTIADDYYDDVVEYGDM